MITRADLDLETLLFLERHETRVHALPGRELRDLGDALLLHDVVDREPFWNRVAAVRWPRDPSRFDRRLAETIALFGTLDRTPHVWPRPLHNEPPDLAARLMENGWRDAGGGLLMVQVDPSALQPPSAGPRRPGVTVERINRPVAPRAIALAADVALVLAESFDVSPDRARALELETMATWDRSEVTLFLVRVDGEAAAVAKRTTFDGASYLSSIGTRPRFRGQGLARLATATASVDADGAVQRWTYLGVFEENVAARRLYETLGFAVVGAPAPDLLLR